MPDWSYIPLFKPLLFKLPAATAKDITLGAVSLLGTLPGGQLLLDFMGGMKPASSLCFQHSNIKFPSRVGLSAGLAGTPGTISAFQHFGLGFIEIGPFTATPLIGTQVERCPNTHSIIWPATPSTHAIDALVGLSTSISRCSIPVMIRLTHAPGTTFDTAMSELSTMLAQIPKLPAVIVLDMSWCIDRLNVAGMKEYFRLTSNSEHCVVMGVQPDLVEADRTTLLEAATECSIEAFYILGGVELNDQRRATGKRAFEATLRTVRSIRSQRPDCLLIAGNGVIEPYDAKLMLDAGANLVSLYSGLVYSGPGLAKRINEIITFDSELKLPGEARLPQEPLPYSFASVCNAGWLGLALVGAGLIVTGSSAITVALTTVILPYDEKFLGISRAALVQLNSNLLPFMSHDRVTYAGSGMSCGLLFAWLSWNGARKGQKWAYVAARASCAFGLASFLLFLGFHYLDPLHALATCLLLPFFLWAVARPPAFRPPCSANLYNSKAWKSGLIGQLLFVGIGIGLLLAGFTICKVGISTVFVPQDLEFMGTSAHELLCSNDHLLPTIAHDRAGFGGSLVTAGVAVLLTALHGFRQGEGWVWWMLLVSGLPGFISTLGIHFAIGYTSFIHLLPAYIATVMFVAGLAASYRYLCTEPGSQADRISSSS